MSRDDIIRMAQAANRYANNQTGDSYEWHFIRDERFAALVAAAEREACEKLIEPSEEHRRDASWGYIGGEEGVELLDAMAAKLRARGQQ